jgi:hypothetical protein
MKLTYCTAALTAAAVTAAASAGPVTSPFLETFDDATTDVDFAFNDFDTQATGTGSQGTSPGWTIQNGQAVFYDNSNFGDAGSADVIINTGPLDAVAFSSSADFDVFSIDFTTTKLGVFAFAQGPADFTENFVGLYAYVQENDTSGGNYDFNLLLGANGNSSVLQTSTSFDLTDGSPDFNIDLVGVADGLGNFDVTATLSPDGDAPIVLTETIAASDLAGQIFGVRTNPGFNTLEVGVDNLAASVIVPEPASAAALGVVGLLGLRRRR